MCASARFAHQLQLLFDSSTGSATFSSHLHGQEQLTVNQLISWSCPADMSMDMGGSTNGWRESIGEQIVLEQTFERE